ncbi:MAG TPA: phage tail tape measure protein [Polyangiaceae bacterium]|nr:phage tail tape measure protein [Polyangiaceae bacterium]
MALNQLGLGFLFTAKDLASGVIGRVENALGGVEDKADKAAEKFKEGQTQMRNVGLAIAGAGIAIIGTAAALAVQAGQFEAAIAAAGARSGATAEEMDRLHAAAFDVRVTLAGFSAEEAALTLKQLAEGGNDAAKSIVLLHPSLTLATVTGRSAAEAAGFLSDTLGLFNIDADDAALTVDKMAVAMRRFGISSSELQPAVVGVASAARLAGASMDDMLLAVGLAKTSLPDVSQATRAVNVAMMQLADPATAAKLRGTFGVVVTEGGRMRPLAEILAEVSKKTASMSESARAAALQSVFGGRAAGGLTVILDQLSAGVRDASGNMVKGADAVRVLRDELGNATGTAEQMRDRMLDTLPGQLQVLRASFSTMSTALGEMFIPVFKPIIRAISTFASQVAAFIGRIPAPIKKLLGGIILAIGGLLTVVGGFIAAKASIALFVVGLKAAGVTLGGIIAAILPVIAVVALLALAAVGLKIAWEKNLGGIRDFVERVWSRVQLFFQAMSQLFSDGGFSGAVMEELNRAENAGIKQFAIRVFQIIYRIKRFFEGIAEGFGAAIEAAQPVFDAFVGALRRLGEALGIVGMEGTDAAAGIPSDEFASFGRVIGQIAGVLVEVFVGALTFVIDVVSTAISVFKEAIKPLQPIFDGVRNAVGLVFEELGKLGVMFGITSGQGQQAGGVMQALSSVAQFLGWVIGNTAAFIAGAIGLMVQFVVQRLAVVIAAFRSVVGFIEGVIDIFGGLVTGNWAQVWVGFKKVVLNAVNFLAQLLLGFVESVLSIVDSIASIFGADLGAADAIKSLRADIEKGLTGGVEDVTAGVQITRATGTANASPAMSAAAAAPGVTASGAELAALNQMSMAAPPRVEAPPVTTNVNLMVDGEVLARATARAERSSAARSFSPLPAPG